MTRPCGFAQPYGPSRESWGLDAPVWRTEAGNGSDRRDRRRRIHHERRRLLIAELDRRDVGEVGSQNRDARTARRRPAAGSHVDDDRRQHGCRVGQRVIGRRLRRAGAGRDLHIHLTRHVLRSDRRDGGIRHHGEAGGRPAQRDRRRVREPAAGDGDRVATGNRFGSRRDVADGGQ